MIRKGAVHEPLYLCPGRRDGDRLCGEAGEPVDGAVPGGDGGPGVPGAAGELNIRGMSGSAGALPDFLLFLDGSKIEGPTITLGILCFRLHGTE